MTTESVCIDCKQVIVPKPGSIGTGYGVAPESGEKICYACCGIRDAKQLTESDRATFYWDGSEITNWPGTLRIKPHGKREGRHNIARTVTTVYFRDSVGRPWSGQQFGSNTQILHCRRISERSFSK